MIKGVVTTLVCFCLLPIVLFAASTSEFSITAFVGEDLEPPTTPALISVIPVATTQIDVEWSVSTDNLLLDGYVLLRDGLPVATTTLNTYSDSGLSSGTLYSYEVYAFDSRGNISTTSMAIATSTLSLPVVPPTPTASTSDSDSSPDGTKVFRLLRSAITPYTNSALFSWETSLPAKFALRWGRDDVYDGGYIINDTYRKEHQTMVSDLEPGTVYFYELIGYTTKGTAFELKRGSFKTDSKVDFVPLNVQNLRAEVIKNDVSLSWAIPSTNNDLKVRVVRSYLGYPTDPYDGAVVYEGKGNNFTDDDALKNYETLYYTVFVFSSEGSVSSGAVVSARKVSTSLTDKPIPTSPLEEDLISIPDFDFSEKNINLVQGDRSFNFKSEEIKLSHQDYFAVSIPYESLPKHLKSIIATLTDPNDQNRSYSFLLRINKDRTAYEAIVAPVGVSGVSRLQVEIFDFEREVIGRYRKQINFVSPSTKLGEVIFPDKLVQIVSPIFPIITIGTFFLLALFFFFYRRRKRAEDNQ